MHQEYQYLDLLGQILEKGRVSGNRTGIRTQKLIGHSMRFDLMRGAVPILPLFTTKKVFFRGVKEELLWFLRGSTDAMELVAKGVHIWDQWMLPEDETIERSLTIAERKAIFAQIEDISMSEAETLIRNRVGFSTIENVTNYLNGLHIPTTEQVILQPKGKLGPIYGASFRHYPAGDYFKNMTVHQLRHYLMYLGKDQKEELKNRLSPDQDMFQELGAVRHHLTSFGIDQLSQAIGLLKTNPNSRRILIDLWNPQAVPPDGCSPQDNTRYGYAALGFCHLGVQFITEELLEMERWDLFRQKAVHDGYIKHVDELVMNGSLDEFSLRYNGKTFPTHRLYCIAPQRSADCALGVPFNIASYALLTHMVAQVCDMIPGQLVWNGGDVHLYENQFEGVQEQLTREPYPFPELKLDPSIDDILGFDSEGTISILDYRHHSAIKMPVAV